VKEERRERFMKLQEKISTRSAKLTPGEFATVRVKR